MLTSSNIEIFIWERSKKQLKNYFRKSIPASFVHLQDFKTLFKSMSTKDVKNDFGDFS